MTNFFITATDTDAGKTYFARILVRALVNRNKKVAVYKPISAGCQLVDGVLINEDAQYLTVEANCGQTIAQVNPVAFLEPIAPHIAANINNTLISLKDIELNFQQLLNFSPDITITEGAGGWRLPLGSGLYLSDFVKAIKAKVILVVNMKLGCLNHAILSYEAIIADGLECVGWVANCQKEMPFSSENISELENLLPIPKLATLNFEVDIDKAAKLIDLSPFI
ncbi:MAG: dethiobiotin synthase [Alteromonadaceae bacterium]|nr:dethiobiotin synthase [Alteromonadaceae bacterium]